MSAEPPPISTLENMAPPALDHVVRTCLAKDPDARRQTAHDVLVDLKWLGEAGSQAGINSTVIGPHVSRGIFACVLVAVISLALASLAFFHFGQRPPDARIARYQIPLPNKMSMEPFDFPVISPDGQRLVLPGRGSDGTRHLWLRSLDSLADQLLPGTEESYFPFWSPDS